MRFLCLALTVLSALAVAQSPASSPAFLPASKATSAASAVVSTSGAAITPAIDPLARATTSTRGPFPTTSYPPQPPQPPGPPPLPQSSLWSYPQPPLPGRTASAPAAAFTVAESSPPALGPRVRKYNFNLGYSVGSPSGFRRRMATINNQFPGPVIEGWQGDTIEVTVVNNLDYPQVRTTKLLCKLTTRAFTGMESCKRTLPSWMAFREYLNVLSSLASRSLTDSSSLANRERTGTIRTTETVSRATLFSRRQSLPRTGSLPVILQMELQGRWQGVGSLIASKVAPR